MRRRRKQNAAGVYSTVFQHWALAHRDLGLAGPVPLTVVIVNEAPSPSPNGNTPFAASSRRRLSLLEHQLAYFLDVLL